MTKLSGKALVAIATLLSLATSGLVYNYLSGISSKPPADSATVVIAKTNISPKTRITADMVQESQTPVTYIQPGAVSDAKLAIGALARDQIAAGEQITERRLVTEGKTGGFTGIIPPDKRAITIAVNEVSGVAGFIKPGDWVDVVATFDQNAAGDNVSHVIMQNILVLASNRDSVAGNQTNAKESTEKEVIKKATITLAVTPEEAAQLTIAEDKGKVRLALRPYMPSMGIAITNAITPKDLVGTHTSPNKSSGDNQAKGAPAVGSAPLAGKGIQMIRGTKIESIPVN